MRKRRNSIALAMELRLFWIKPSICHFVSFLNTEMTRVIEPETQTSWIFNVMAQDDLAPQIYTVDLTHQTRDIVP